MNYNKDIENDFLKKGYIIQDIENKNSIEYISKFIINKLKKIISSNKDISKISLNDIHKTINASELNSIRVNIISEINKDKELRNHYFNLAKNCIDNIVGNELAMQNNLNLSIQFPNDESSLLPLHSDTWSGDSPFEVVLWVPLVDCYKTKSMFILDYTQMENFNKKYKDKKINKSSDLHKEFEKNLIFLKVNYGQFLLFNQNIPHGNIVNKTNETRWSMNCRFKGLFTPYAEKKLGQFFSPLNVKPATRIGIDYKFPGEEE